MDFIFSPVQLKHKRTRMKILLSFFSIPFLISKPINSIGGNWCGYETERMVECKVRNGSEFYLSSTPICGIHQTQDCVQRVFRRPKYVTALKKVTEIKYKCCPTFTGTTCQIECMNCASFKLLEEKVKQLEGRLMKKEEEEEPMRKKEEEPKLKKEEEPLPDHNEVLVDEGKTGRLLTNVRNLDYRLELVERELGRMMEMRARVRSAGPPYDHSPQIGGKSEEEEDVVRTFKILEHNLARGDIASTLNDDYGEEKQLSDEDYTDELKHDN